MYSNYRASDTFRVDISVGKSNLMLVCSAYGPDLKSARWRLYVDGEEVFDTDQETVKKVKEIMQNYRQTGDIFS